MKDELLGRIEREMLGPPAVSKKIVRSDPGQGGFRVPPATIHGSGRGLAS